MTDLCYPAKRTFLNVDQARSAIQSALTAVKETEILDLADCLGRVLAEPLYCPLDLPPDRNSAMDGYALSSHDIIAGQAFSLTEAGTAWAGKPFTGEVKPGQCIRIFTGAVVPAFADSVIVQEQVQRQELSIHFPADCQAGKNIRSAGSDLGKGSLLLQAPKKLTANDIALLASAGIARIAVKRKLRVAFLSTGDELRSIGQPLVSGEIYDSNRYALAALLQDRCIVASDLGLIADDPQRIETVLLDAAQNHDVLISSGGASVGDADYIKQVLEKCGQVNFWKIAIKPGKPLTFGFIGDCVFFGLPGNPVAVLVTFDVFVRPALQQLSGTASQHRLQLQARCLTALRKAPGRREYQRGVLEQTATGELQVSSAGGQDSHQLSAASRANCYIILEEECSGVSIGDTVSIEPFDIWL